MAKTFTYQQNLAYPIADVYEMVYKLTIEQMESVGTAKKTPSAIVGTEYEYEMMLKKQQTTTLFTITEYVKNATFNYQIKAGRLVNKTNWQFEQVDEQTTKITYQETAESDLTSATMTYRFLGWMMSRKQKKKAQQLFKVIEIQLYEAKQKNAA